MGRRAFQMADDPDWYVGNYEFQVPIFVLTHELPAVPPKQDERLTFTFVADGLESAISQAMVAAGDRAVTGPTGSVDHNSEPQAGWSSASRATGLSPRRRKG